MMAMEPSRWHAKAHRPGPMETCWYCGKDRAKCTSKLFRYVDRDQAFAEVKKLNEADGFARPRLPYFCYWCGMYHFTTKIGKRTARVRKQKRRWLAEQECRGIRDYLVLTSTGGVGLTQRELEQVCAWMNQAFPRRVRQSQPPLDDRS